MQSITLDEIKPGMILSRPLILDDGTVLLNEGIEIKARYIEYLRNMGVDVLFVGEAGLDDSLPDEVPGCDKEWKKEISRITHDTIREFRVGKGVHLAGVKKVVDDLIQQMSQDPTNLVHFLDIRRKKRYMFSHAVNTCILAVMTGISLGYSQQELAELGLAAMLHDIGKIKFSRKLALQFPGQLSSDDYDEYRRHSFYALEILRKNPKLSVNVVNACFQHHERWNGSGYPLGIRGEAIGEYAQIIGIADVYDRLLVGLPHRLPTPVYYAVAILNKAAGEYFNPALIDLFNQNIAIYPMGKTVKLNNQQNGVILGVGIKNKTTPIIRLLSQQGKPLSQTFELDLLKNPELFIVDFEDPYFSYEQAQVDRAYHASQAEVTGVRQ